MAMPTSAHPYLSKTSGGDNLKSTFSGAFFMAATARVTVCCVALFMPSSGRSGSGIVDSGRFSYSGNVIF
jgi:hypothetical protein